MGKKTLWCKIHYTYYDRANLELIHYTTKHKLQS